MLLIAGPFDILAGHQCQQRQRLRRGILKGLGVEPVQQPSGIGDQRVDQPVAGDGIVPGNPRLARVGVVVGTAFGDDTSAAPATSPATRRIAAISWVTVS